MWTATFTQDTESKGIGTVTTADDATGASYSRRVNTTDANDVRAFVAEAKAVAKKQGDRKKDASDVVTAIAAQLNG